MNDQKNGYKEKLSGKWLRSIMTFFYVEHKHTQ